MKTKVYRLGVIFLLLNLMLSTLLFYSTAIAGDKFKVVATLSTFADLAKQIGGERVEVSSIAAPKFNPHFIEPRPSDVLKLKRCDLFLHGGLDLEAWREPLLDAAARPEIRVGGDKELDLSRGVKLLEVPDRILSRAEGDIHLFGNPHYWLDPNNALIMARTISAALSRIDPASAEIYQRRLTTFIDTLTSKMNEWQNLISSIKGGEIVSYHNEWIYLLEYSGLYGDKFLEPKPGIPPTPQHTEFLTQYMREHKVLGIIQASYFPTDVAQKIAKNTGVKLALLCQSVGESVECGDYQEMLSFNLNSLAKLKDG